MSALPIYQYRERANCRVRQFALLIKKTGQRFDCIARQQPDYVVDGIELGENSRNLYLGTLFYASSRLPALGGEGEMIKSFFFLIMP